MIHDKKVIQHYLKTGILGAYETAEVDDEMKFDDKVAPCFDDAVTNLGQQRATIRRTMDIGGRTFHICSVFPSNAQHTPTDKLLSLIDSELGKD